MAGFGLGKKALLTALGVAGGSGIGVALALDQSVKADLTLHPPVLPWSHNGPIDSLDHESIRRGYQVYKQVKHPSCLHKHVFELEVFFAGLLSLPQHEIHRLP